MSIKCPGCGREWLEEEIPQAIDHAPKDIFWCNPCLEKKVRDAK